MYKHSLIILSLSFLFLAKHASSTEDPISGIHHQKIITSSPLQGQQQQQQRPPVPIRRHSHQHSQSNTRSSPLPTPILIPKPPKLETVTSDLQLPMDELPNELTDDTPQISSPRRLTKSKSSSHGMQSSLPVTSSGWSLMSDLKGFSRSPNFPQTSSKPDKRTIQNMHPAALALMPQHSPESSKETSSSTKTEDGPDFPGLRDVPQSSYV